MSDTRTAARTHLRPTTLLPGLHGMLWCSLVLLSLLGLAGCSEPEATPTLAPTVVAALPVPAPIEEATMTPTLTTTPIESTATGTATATTTATGCPAPAGWAPYTVVQGDTLSSLGAASGATVAELMQANCLVDDKIYEGQTLHLPVAPPPTATPTPEPTRCGAPAGWVVYVVQPGETLSGLAAAVGAAVEEIRLANCLPDDTIYAGRGLRLPRVPAGADTGASPSTSTSAPVAVVERPTRAPRAICTPFSCSIEQPQDPPIDFGTGGPGTGDLCRDGEAISIDRDGGTVVGDDPVIVGSKLTFAACGINSTQTVTFTLIASGGETSLLPTSTELVAGTLVPAAKWVATCAEAGRQYTISYTVGASGTSITRAINLDKPIDLSGYVLSLGNDRYRIHYCYENPPVLPIQLKLYNGSLDADGRCIGITYREGEKLNLDSDRSGYLDLTLPLASDTGNCYGIEDMSNPFGSRMAINLSTTGGDD